LCEFRLFVEKKSQKEKKTKNKTKKLDQRGELQVSVWLRNTIKTQGRVQDLSNSLLKIDAGK